MFRKPPEPVESWEPEIIDAFEFREACVQPIIPGFANFHPSAEDCLFLSIYVPGKIDAHSFFLYSHSNKSTDANSQNASKFQCELPNCLKSLIECRIGMIEIIHAFAFCSRCEAK